MFSKIIIRVGGSAGECDPGEFSPVQLPEATIE